MKMNAVIVEDEIVAAQNLERLLISIDENIHITTVLQSVDQSIEWFSTHPMPDVVFMDIHLADGDSFSIFKRVDVDCPIIFTTAYDQYALKAFEVNSIDYLLKPISKNSLQKAINKLHTLSGNRNNVAIIHQLLSSINQNDNAYKKSFLIPFKDKLIPVSSDEIAFVYAENKKAVISCFNKQEYTMDTSLDDFLSQLDPDLFFRANRQFIIAHKAVSHLTVWFDGKLAIHLLVDTPEKIIVSRARSAEFKNWYISSGNK
jgi:two-component system response regulator LytT